MTLGAALGLAPAADAFVYWANNSGGTIGRANLDGRSANQHFISGANAPGGVAVDGAHIYWVNGDGRTIGRANLDGTGAQKHFISGAILPSGVAVDGAHIYWHNISTIGRANLDGTGVNQSFISGANAPGGVAVDGAHIYWTNGGGPPPGGGGPSTIGRANLDGTGADQRFISSAGSPSGVAVDGAHIYWADAGGPAGGTIARANLDGTGVNQSFIAAANGPGGVAVDGAHIYWTNPFTNAIGRANLDGTRPNQRFVSGASRPEGIAVDARGPGSTGAPVLGRSARVSRVSGRVRVRLRGSRRFFDLVGARTIPFGSTVDTTAGRVRLTTAVRGGGQQMADFYAGLFVPTQARSGLTTLALPAAEGCGKRASARTARRRSHRLWGNGHGSFRTRGRYGAATVRGTNWLTENRCGATFFHVARGVVAVSDFVKHKTVTLRPGKSYLARARRG